jgi:phosphoribosylformimino-5-aminoimidazole carboxamide ribotide isomerase
MDLYPAIDLRDGRCVRLTQGDFARETVYGDDPVGQARVFADAGTPWIHVVDLDAARTGEPVNRPVVAAIAGSIGTPVQVGGGVRDEMAAEALLDIGVSRVVVGTAALEQPELVHRLAGRWPGQVALGLDVRGSEVAVHGWEQGTGRQLLDVVRDFEESGVAAVVVTQIEVDGVGAGPDLETYAGLLVETELDVIASGGVGSLDHLRDLAALEIEGRELAGVIVGRALYDGAFTVDDALAATTGTV